MPYDYTNAPAQREIELIPHGTIATVVMHIRAGGVGEDGMLKRSRAGDCEMLDVELTVTDGPYKGRKLWENWILEGTKLGHATSIEINRSTIRAIIDSACGLKPDDDSPQARAMRTRSLGQLQGLTFIARIGIEQGKPKGSNNNDCWPDKNILAGVVTPDKKDWHPVEQPPPFNGGNSRTAASTTLPATTPAITRPGWAT
jgi:hypothetical protein